MVTIWEWLGELKPAQAAITAALLGFLTLTAGHLINSGLNRKRDKFLLDMERLNLLRSIIIEITQISNLVRLQLHQTEPMVKDKVLFSVINPVSLAVIYRNNLSNIHKLPPETLLYIVPFYIGLLEHDYNLVTHGAERVGDNSIFQTFNIGNIFLADFRRYNTALDGICQVALENCSPIVRLLEAKLEGRTSPPPPNPAFKPSVADDV